MKTAMLYALLLLPFIGMAQNTESFSVHFNFDKYDLTAATVAQLDSFIAANTVTKASIQLHGHCDFVGSNRYNDALSTKRVRAVEVYLLQHYIPVKEFVTTAGHGKRQPLNDNASARERLLNRRVEIIITKAIPVAETTTLAKKADTIIIAKSITPPLPEKKLTEQIEDTATKSGTSIVLKNINFIGARHQLLPESYPTLKELLAVMLKNKNLKIQVQGHICCLPGNVDGFDEETSTTNLSELRAKAVMDYLIENGVAPGRISYIGLGHSQPIYSYPEKNEEEKKLNRRVEIKIISK